MFSTATGWKLENTYAELPELFFSKLRPVPVKNPQLVLFNEAVAEFLALEPRELKNSAGLAILAGNGLPEGSVPLAQAYAGHQFGHFTILGDGRAILLGEQITPSGKCFDIQLKGSGRTPYSRGGDGRATLGPMLREYIISEAMYALGIPTSRSLAVVTTGEKVMRETALPGAILTRVAASHIRVGTFQYAAYRGNYEELKALADYTLARHFVPALEKDNPYLNLLQEVIKRQASLIANWLLLGFIHGVMNTDNMAISGETIDYGPCAFMDSYNPQTVFSSIDRNGRYAYSRQPLIAQWNLARFAESILPLICEDEEKALSLAQDAIAEFSELYEYNWLKGMRAKLGISSQEPQDKDLIEKLLAMMEKYRADYTNTFRSLTLARLEQNDLFKSPEFALWYAEWQNRLSRQNEPDLSVRKLMQGSNPGVIPRNHQVEAALEAAVKEKDYSVMEKLIKVLAKPYAYLPEQEEYAAPPAPPATPYHTFCGT